MARGPDGRGVAAGGSLADRLFNADTIGILAAEHAGLPGFDPGRFVHDALAGLGDKALLARLDHIADALEAQLPRDFPAMAEALEAAMPPPLDPGKTDDDFGHFVHAVPGILAVRHGLEAHPDRALDLLHAATQRFSMEFSVRPFLDRWPTRTLGRLQGWAEDPHYHVRRLVSEGTRPRLPWGRAVSLAPQDTLPLLDRLHADPTRFVTRSVANHLNDIARHDAGAVVDRLAAWQRAGQQRGAELDWMRRHALRGALKRGDAAALAHLGYGGAAVAVSLALDDTTPRIGAALSFAVTVHASAPMRALVDYRIRFARPSGRAGEKVYKLNSLKLHPDTPVRLEKRHPLKAGASTFTLHPGRHTLTVQVNGQDAAQATFDLVPAQP